MTEKREHPKVKSNLHPRSKHRGRYDFPALTQSSPELKAFVKENKYGDESIDFFDPRAVKMLNTAILKHFYKLEFWEIPKGYLCPPIPGRADYLHYMADLLAEANKKEIPKGEKVKVLDIGVGANCIYPILGNVTYGWSFIGTDVDKIALGSAKRIVKKNDFLKEKVEIRPQPNENDILRGVIQKGEVIDLVICNPPFHGSAKEAREATQRKLRNLKGKIPVKAVRNFGGKNQELWCEGGEKGFIEKMIRESTGFSTSCLWFSSLVSKKSSLKVARKIFKKIEKVEFKVIEMGTGNKITRILVWSFLNKEQRAVWFKDRFS